MNKKHKKGTSEIIEDKIFITGKRTGFIRLPKKDDIEISEENLNTALHNDLVKVEIKDKKSKVIKIVERAKIRFVGTILQDENGNYLKSDNPKFYPHLEIGETNEYPGKNIKVLVEMSPWNNPQENPQGQIIKTIGKKGENETEMESILLEKGFEPNFPNPVEKEASHISNTASKDFEVEIKKRKDFRNKVTFTIDPDDAKDFDDALSFHQLDNGNIEVGIHIADVTHYIDINSTIDKEAVQRCTSVYLVDRTIPMLPETLSNDLCSLNPNENKLTFSAVFILDKKGQVVEKWFGETIINSNKRFTYKTAQETLDKGTGKFHNELKTLDDLAKIMRAERTKQGAISFGSNEYKFKLDEQGKAIEVYKKELMDTNELVEDFMLLANKEVASYIGQKEKELKIQLPFVYRVHDYPKPDQISELIEFLKTIGYHLNKKEGKVSSRDLNDLLEKIEGSPEENLIATATLRSMTKAIYSVNNIGHYGLAFKYYTHFTSPIRRYPDMMVHRLMKRYLTGNDLTPRSIKKYKELTIKSTQQEIAAVNAERDSQKFKFVELMTQKIGEKFDGIISGITKWGVYVQVENGAQGMISLRSLKDDFYELDAKKYRLVGQKNHLKYTLGDKIKVRLVKTDLEKRVIDFELAN
ncbi:MAG: ribonuclease R [Patescibacteria group bacterium]|nr:ribonuclease R [Patescibacteria group bacterium]